MVWAAVLYVCHIGPDDATPKHLGQPYCKTRSIARLDANTVKDKGYERKVHTAVVSQGMQNTSYQSNLASKEKTRGILFFSTRFYPVSTTQKPQQIVQL